MNKTIISLLFYALIVTTPGYSKKIILNLGINNIEAYPDFRGNSDELLTPPGISVEVLIQAAKDIGIELNILRYPTKRLFSTLQDGHLDAICCMSYQDARTEIGHFPLLKEKIDKKKRISEFSYYFYIFKNNHISWDGKKLAGVELIGANRGFSIVKDLKKLGYQVNEVNTNEQNLQMLIKQRIQTYAGQNKTVDPMIANNPMYKNIIRLNPPIKSKPYYLMFSKQFIKKHSQIAEEMWTRISKIRNSVRIKRIDFYTDNFKDLVNSKK